MFVITRNAWQNDVDYLAGWDAKWGTSAAPIAARALRFATYQEAEAAKARAERLVPKWVCGTQIVYGIARVVRS